MSTQKPQCQRLYQARSKRWGQRCTAPAMVVIRANYGDREVLVCGTHARTWIPSVRHPLGRAGEMPA